MRRRLGFYYLRVLTTLFAPPAEAAGEAGALSTPPAFAWGAGAALLVLGLLLLGLGLYPAPVLRLIQAVAPVA